MKKIFLCILLITIFLFRFSLGAEINLKEALSLIKEKNYDSKINFLEIKKNEGSYIQSGLFQNPTLSVNYTGLSFGRNIVYDTGNTLFSVRIDQPIELGGKREYRKFFAYHQLESTKYQTMDSIRAIFLDFTDIYFQTLADKAYVDYLQNDLNEFEKILEVQSKKHQLGFLSLIEFTKLKLYKMELENAIIQAKGNYQKDLKDFNFYLIGDYSPADINLPQKTEIDINNLIKTAIEKRENIKALQEQLKSVDYQIKLLKAYTIPDISVGVEYDAFGTNYKPGIGFGFSLNLPIFDKRQGDLLTSLATKEQTYINLEKNYALIKSQIEKAFYDYQVSKDIYNSFIEKKKVMDDLVERTKKAYLLGGVSILDFLDTERTYKSFMNDFIQAKYNYLKNYYKLKILSGDTDDL
ncbi:TolC family protein [Venenivibrio stagnispumantis]|uniref:Outer membrane protein, cobalt-zinc-cadmium efflux system n=1 Tax=Venenivibrio stagnispumantis TaxID=407998 RepID=A0AA46AET5_9AQUI|nr:TolC family protein [Venenivibrio stagnispumantis]MCW4573760.1 TolC family protein [Venenivibrio stagnispumantis]SMP15156.1 outer membrane protein, cobalt-zinc-cadmium efflux system [Venenivibrio stagnispumantis]